MDATKLQELILELKTGPQPDETVDDAELALGFPDPEEMLEDGVDPQFVLYSTVQTQLLMMAAMLDQSGIVDQYHEIFESALDTYMPGFPPMSPVTDSYFHSWALYDLEFGDDGDNIGRIAADITAEMGMPLELRELCGKLLNSRMGIYETIDVDSDLIVVRELITGHELLVDVPTGYFGEEGDLRFVRLGPPAIPDAEYFTELTTPYILEGRSADDWCRYLKSVMPQSVVSEDGSPSTLIEDRLAAVFKEDRGPMPWLEFVFQGYRGFEEDVIFLTGIPDVPASLPHGEDTVATNSNMVIDRQLLEQAKAMGISIIPPGTNESDELEVALTDAQRQAAAELMLQLSSVFKPTTKGKKRIQLPESDWEELTDLATAQLMREPGRGVTRLRNLITAVGDALSEADTTDRPLADTGSETIYRMRIDLRGITPPIWRRVEVSDCSLAELHVVVQAAMGWTDCHLHEFEIDLDRYSVPSPFGGDEDMGTIDARDVWLSEVIRGKGAKLRYMYDFGDGWDHSIKVEAVEAGDPSQVYPRCVKGNRNCPPEDCGGVCGYQELLEILSDPKHPEHEERIEWIGEFDSESFDAAESTGYMQSWLSSVAQPKRPASASSSGDFDINLDLFDDDGELDDEQFEAWSVDLQNEFTNSPEFQGLPEGEYGFLNCLFGYSVNYVGETPVGLSVSDLNEILFDVIPRKVMAEPQDAVDIVAEFNAFFRFIHREYSIAGAEKLANMLDNKAARRLAKALGNDSNFGMAKSFASQGKAAGYDMTSPEGLNQFMMAYNSGLAQPVVSSREDVLAEDEHVEYTPTIRHQTPRLGRNDPCHCGSGKKYKKCCLSNDQ
jgi:hypothetical protein